MNGITYVTNSHAKLLKTGGYFSRKQYEYNPSPESPSWVSISHGQIDELDSRQGILVNGIDVLTQRTLQASCQQYKSPIVALSIQHLQPGTGLVVFIQPL